MTVGQMAFDVVIALTGVVIGVAAVYIANDIDLKESDKLEE